MPYVSFSRNQTREVEQKAGILMSAVEGEDLFCYLKSFDFTDDLNSAKQKGKKLFTIAKKWFKSFRICMKKDGYTGTSNLKTGC